MKSSGWVISVYIYIYIYIYIIPLSTTIMCHKVIFWRRLTGFKFLSETSCNSEFHTFPTCIALGRVFGFVPIPEILTLCEVSTASSRVRKRFSVSIFLWLYIDYYDCTTRYYFSIFLSFTFFISLSLSLSIYIYIYIYPETGVQSHFESFQRLKNGTWCRLA